MTLRTDRQDGGIIENEDINEIAAAVNANTAAVNDLTPQVPGGGYMTINGVVTIEAGGNTPYDGGPLVFDAAADMWVAAPPGSGISGPGGSTDHAALNNRDAPDQHPIGAVTGLQAALNGKAATGHGHTIGDVEYLQIALDSKAEGGHTHTAADVTSGTLDLARIPTGTTSSTVALGNHGHTSSSITNLTEAVQDIVGAFIKAGTNTSVTYDDAANTFTINATASSGGTTDPEVVRDTIAGALVAGSGVQIVVNDADDTIVVSSTAVLPTRKIIAGTGLTGGGDLSTDRTLNVAYGSTEGTAAEGNHTHPVAGLETTGIPSATTFLRGDGTWATPSGLVTGAGSPEGVVTAPVSTEYLDTAGTNGAIKWIKVSGTGNTGWRVSYGDTGTRSVLSGIVNSELVMPDQGKVDIRRVGQIVTMYAELLLNTPINGSSMYTILNSLPLGFRPAILALPSVHLFMDVHYPLASRIFTNGLMELVSPVQMTPIGVQWDVLSFYATWPTNNSWPTTLPGTAA